MVATTRTGEKVKGTDNNEIMITLEELESIEEHTIVIEQMLDRIKRYYIEQCRSKINQTPESFNQRWN